MNTRVRTTSHILKSPAKHGKIVKSPSQQEKKEKIEKQASRLVEAQKASMNKRRLNKEKKMALLEDVDKLKKKLRHEESVHRALERAFTRPLGALPRLPPYLPPSTLELLAEVAVLEEEIVLLEGQVVNFRQGLYEEAVYISSSKRNKENQTDLGNTKRKQFKEDQPSSSSSQSDGTYMVNLAQLGSNRNLDRIANCSKRYAIGKEFLKKPESSSLLSDDRRNKDNQTSITTPTKSNKQSPNSIERIRRPVKRASMDQKTMEKLLEPLEHKVECRMVDQSVAKENSLTISDERGPEGESSTPNKISEDLLKCLKTIFMRMSVQNREDYKETEFRDPYGVCKEFQQRNIGPYKCLCAIESSSINTSRMTTSWFLLQRLKLLLGKLAAVDLQGLTHQQKLALWINIYNSCMMNAFLEHGIPESPQMVVALMQKAMINVGGQSLNAMTIEHFILRLPYHSKDMYTKGDAKSDEIKARSIIGLEWSEPLVTFALSCGSWSSPALRVYTASGIENQLEEAKKDYLQAAIRISTDQKIGIPKLLDWYLLDFAKDFQSLLDWICLQLPSDLRKEALECLEGSSKEILARSVQVMPYEFSFRYLLHQ